MTAQRVPFTARGRSPGECQWWGAPGRLHGVPRASVERRLPTVGEQDEGMWWLHFTDGAKGPFPSAQAAWDHRHANGDGEAPVPSQAKPKEAPCTRSPRARAAAPRTR